VQSGKKVNSPEGPTDSVVALHRRGWTWSWIGTGGPASQCSLHPQGIIISRPCLPHRSPAIKSVVKCRE
jgi:hypothetical protein